jgi:hypothetical protein
MPSSSSSSSKTSFQNKHALNVYIRFFNSEILKTNNNNIKNNVYFKSLSYTNVLFSLFCEKETEAISDAMVDWHNRLYGTTTRVPSITIYFYLRRF